MSRACRGRTNHELRPDFRKKPGLDPGFSLLLVAAALAAAFVLLSALAPLATGLPARLIFLAAARLLAGALVLILLTALLAALTLLTALGLVRHDLSSFWLNIGSARICGAFRSFPRERRGVGWRAAAKDWSWSK